MIDLDAMEARAKEPAVNHESQSVEAAADVLDLVAYARALHDEVERLRRLLAIKNISLGIELAKTTNKRKEDLQ